MNNLPVTLSNFILMEEAEPEDFEVYLLITKDGQMSAACYTTGTLYPQGVFRQSRGGVWEKEDIYAILPIENEYVDLKSFVN